VIKAYHIDLGQRDVRIGMYDDFDFDNDGIPRYPYGGEPMYNPTFVAHFGLYELGLYLRTGAPDRLARFLKTADWFLKTGRRRGSGLVFEYSIPMPGLPSTWVSALGQGRAISVLTRAFEATADVAYRNAALEAVGLFRTPVDEGGVRTEFPDGGIAFEEYPRPRPDIVLNGLITALFGLFDAAMLPSAGTAGDVNESIKMANALFDESVASLGHNLFRYDLGYWSAYDMSGRVASDEYHAYHVTLLWALYEISGVDALSDYATRWDRCPRGPRLFFARNYSRLKSRMVQRSLYRS
jgi:hypothetical protein